MVRAHHITEVEFLDCKNWFAPGSSIKKVYFTIHGLDELLMSLAQLQVFTISLRETPYDEHFKAKPLDKYLWQSKSVCLICHGYAAFIDWSEN